MRILSLRSQLIAGELKTMFHPLCKPQNDTHGKKNEITNIELTTTWHFLVVIFGLVPGISENIIWEIIISMQAWGSSYLSAPSPMCHEVT
jgi:hypothetical protein